MSYTEQNSNISNYSKQNTPLRECQSNEKSLNRATSKSSKKSLKSTQSASIYCFNHPTKIAQYISQNNSQICCKYYCQRCAILQASQGYNVKKIEHKKISRKQQVQQFLKNIKQLNLQLVDKKEAIKDNLINSQQFYGKQIQQIDDYFKIVYQSLELEKNKCYNYILNQRKNAQQNSRQLSIKIDSLNQQLTQIIQDIQESIDAVYQIDQASYRPVISSYQIKKNNIEENAKEIRIEPIQLRKIQFTGVPETIYSLSEIITKQSYDDISDPRTQPQHLQKTNSLMFSFEGDPIFCGKSEQTLRSYLKMWD